MSKTNAVQMLEKRIRAFAARSKDAVPLRRVTKEWEVVFLLGAIAAEAGFKLKAGSDLFPDAEIDVEMEDGTNETIAVEVEYRASRFSHKVDGCDAIICWRKDAENIGSLAIIALEPLFPHLETEAPDSHIGHDVMNPGLSKAFFLIQDWLFERKLASSGTGSPTETNTITFKMFSDTGQRSLCSLQYYNDAGYLQFKWFKDAIRILGKSDVFVQALALIRNLILSHNSSQDETEKEYRINIYAQDYPVVSKVLEILGVVFQQ